MGRGSTILIAGILAFVVLTFVGRLTVARTLSDSDWGQFNLGLSLTGLLSITALLGLAQAVARSLAFESDPREQRAIVRWSLGVAGALAVVASATVYLLAPALAGLFQTPGLSPVFRILSITIGFTVLSTTLAAIFQGFHEVFSYALFVQALPPALFVAFLLLFWEFHLQLTTALVAYVLAGGLALGAQLWHAYGRLAPLPPPGPAFRRPNSSLWSLSVSLWGVTSLAFITAFADTLILGVFRPSTQVGYYAPAMTLARLLIVASGTLTFVYLPVTSYLARHRAYDALRRTYVTATRWVLVLTVPLFLLFAFSPELAVNTIFGASYAPAAEPLRLLVVTAFVSNLLGPVNTCLAGLAQARVQLSTSAVSAVGNVALSFGLIPVYGVYGASAAWGIARALYPALGLVALYRLHGITPFRRLLIVPLAITLAVGAPLFTGISALEPPHWVIVPMFLGAMALYLAVLLLTRSLVSEDLTVVSIAERFLRRPLPWLRGLVLGHLARSESLAGRGSGRPE